MHKILAWFLALSTIALVLLISAVCSIRDLEDAQRQLGAEYEKVNQYKLTHPQSDNEFIKQLDGLVSAHFAPDKKSFILEVKMATAILVIFIQAVLFICVWVRKHQRDSQYMHSSLQVEKTPNKSSLPTGSSPTNSTPSALP